MNERGFTEKDWKLFRKRLTVWQEAYMEELLGEYAELLNEDRPASRRFWDLEKRIKHDKRKKGVIVYGMSRSKLFDIALSLLDEGVITLDDLDGFSDEFVETIKYLYRPIEKDAEEE